MKQPPKQVSYELKNGKGFREDELKIMKIYLILNEIKKLGSKSKPKYQFVLTDGRCEFFHYKELAEKRAKVLFTPYNIIDHKQSIVVKEFKINLKTI